MFVKFVSVSQVVSLKEQLLGVINCVLLLSGKLRKRKHGVMSQINLNELEKKAQAATPGPWFDIPHEKFSGSDHRISRIANTPWGNFGHLATVTAINASFIAACSPAVILALVARVRALEKM